MLTQGLGTGLVPPKRSGRDGPVIFGPGINVIGSDFPRHVPGGVPCTANDIERLVRTEKSIRASFISLQILLIDILQDAA